jgi:hypothetical protein
MCLSWDGGFKFFLGMSDKMTKTVMTKRLIILILSDIGSGKQGSEGLEQDIWGNGSGCCRNDLQLWHWIQNTVADTARLPEEVPAAPATSAIIAADYRPCLFLIRGQFQTLDGFQRLHAEEVLE